MILFRLQTEPEQIPNGPERIPNGPRTTRKFMKIWKTKRRKAHINHWDLTLGMEQRLNRDHLPDLVGELHRIQSH